MALRLARVDAWFGIMAALALAAGLMRLFFGARAPDYDVVNIFFWEGRCSPPSALISICAIFCLSPLAAPVRADASFRPPAREIARCGGRSTPKRVCLR